MQQIETLKDLSHYYNSTDSRYIYFDKTFDIRGIDYTKFIQLRHESINSNHIKDIYSVDGWYILWYLMSRAIKNEYIATTLNSISEEVNIKTNRIKDALTNLTNKEIIIVDKNKITNNELLRIYIGYNNKLFNYANQNGYIPIPNDFVYKVITTLSPLEWAIYTILISEYRYYIAWEMTDKETKKLIPIYYRTHYAFPNRNHIGEKINVIDDTVSKFVKKLENNKYKLIHAYKSEPYSFWDEKEKIQKVRGGNNRYEIKLLERPEYTYYYFNTPFDTTMQEEFNRIKKIGFEEIAKSGEQYRIRNKKIYYIRYYYKDMFEQYDKCLKEGDYELYKYIRENIKITI